MNERAVWLNCTQVSHWTSCVVASNALRTPAITAHATLHAPPASVLEASFRTLAVYSVMSGEKGGCTDMVAVLDVS